MLSTALRTTSISLESSHQRIDNLLETVAGPGSIRYAVVDFTRALNAKDDQPSAATDGLMDLFGIGSMKRDETSPQSIQAVFTQALGVGTWFKIDKEAQKALLQAGEYAIYIQNPEYPTAGRKLLKEMRSIRDAF